MTAREVSMVDEQQQSQFESPDGAGHLDGTSVAGRSAAAPTSGSGANDTALLAGQLVLFDDQILAEIAGLNALLQLEFTDARLRLSQLAATAEQSALTRQLFDAARYWEQLPPEPVPGQEREWIDSWSEAERAFCPRYSALADWGRSLRTSIARRIAAVAMEIGDYARALSALEPVELWDDILAVVRAVPDDKTTAGFHQTAAAAAVALARSSDAIDHYVLALLLDPAAVDLPAIGHTALAQCYADAVDQEFDDDVCAERLAAQALARQLLLPARAEQLLARVRPVLQRTGVPVPRSCRLFEMVLAAQWARAAGQRSDAIRARERLAAEDRGLLREILAIHERS